MCQLPDAAVVFTSNGAIRTVDSCMRSLVQFLNDQKIQTFDCCCGHGTRWGHVTISVAQADQARALGLRICHDKGVSSPTYPFTGDLDGYVNIILPPIVQTEAPAA